MNISQSNRQANILNCKLDLLPPITMAKMNEKKNSCM